MAIISFYGEKDIRVDNFDHTILKISLKNRIPHIRECGGKGRCTTCRVIVLEGMEHISPRNELESEVAQQKGWDEKTRLACQTKISGDVTIQRLVTNKQEIFFLDALSEIAAGKERKIAVMFSDVRNFTSFSEKNLPYDVTHILNRYFQSVGEPILNNRGYIDKYIGDGILAIFGLNEGNAAQICRNAIWAGLGMLNYAREFNRTLKKDFGIEFEIGIGVHFGEAIVGMIGHPSKTQFTALGDTVNIASRIESSNKNAGTQFLVSDTVYQLLTSELQIGKIIDMELKGKSDTFRLYEVLDVENKDVVFLVQNSFAKIAPHKYQVGKLFYQKLFELSPQVKHLFTRDLNDQIKMLMQVLHTAIQSLSRFHEIKGELEKLAILHLRYGVEEHHYPLVGQALIATLQEFLADDFTPEIKRAWEKIYNDMAQVMINATRQVDLKM